MPILNRILGLVRGAARKPTGGPGLAGLGQPHGAPGHRPPGGRPSAGGGLLSKLLGQARRRL